MGDGERKEQKKGERNGEVEKEREERGGGGEKRGEVEKEQKEQKKGEEREAARERRAGDRRQVSLILLAQI